MAAIPVVRRDTSLLIWLAAAVAVVAIGCSSSRDEGPAGQQNPTATSADTAAPASVQPRQSVNALMVTMVDNAGHVLWDAEKAEFTPKNDADWTEIQDHAIQLAAASTVIQIGGTGPTDNTWARDPRWRADAQKMGDAAMAAHTAATQKNLEGLVAANSTLVESCESCHKQFKPDLPTEGIVHQRPHSESHPGNQ